MLAQWIIIPCDNILNSYCTKGENNSPPKSQSVGFAKFNLFVYPYINLTKF